jgi:stringent starvation protein B
LNELMKGPEHGSTRPYLIRALYEWCTDNGLTPYVAVQVDESVQVPREFVKNNEIVLNISFDATSSLKLGNEFIEFKARFGGVAREIVVPIERVIAIYARENGQGMAFPAAPLPTSAGPEPLAPQPVTGTSLALASAPDPSDSKVSPIGPEATRSTDEPPPQPPKPSPGRPSLKRIK